MSIRMIAAWVFSVGFAYGQEARLPSLNYWDLSARLMQNEGLRDAVDLAPTQLAALREMRADVELQQIFSLKAKMLKRTQIVQTGETLTGEQVALAIRSDLDSVIRTRLLKFMHSEQLEELQIAALRDTYLTGYSPYFAKEIQSHCGFSCERLLETIQKVKSKSDAESLQVAWNSCQKFVSKLPPSVRKKVAYYFGAAHFPLVNIDVPEFTRLNSEALPFPPHGGGSFAILQDDTIRTRLKILDSQVEELQRLWDELNIAIDNLKPPAPPNAMENYNARYFGLHAQHRARTEAILTASQIKEMGRLFAFGEYKQDPTHLLERNDFIEYLAIPSEELNQIRQAARVEREFLQNRRDSINHASFVSISETLDPVSRERLLNLFAGVWD